MFRSYSFIIPTLGSSNDDDDDGIVLNEDERAARIKVAHR